MTVQDIVQNVTYVGDGAQTQFVFNFRVDSINWVAVEYTDNLQSVALNADQDSNPGGTVTYSVAPPNGQSVHIKRDTPRTQLFDYKRYGAFDSEAHEDALDKLTMIIQDLIGNDIDILLQGLDGLWTFDDFVGNYTLQLGDLTKMLRANQTGGTQTVTVPRETSVQFPVGTQISVAQKGTAEVNWVGEGPVVINSPYSNRIDKRYGTVTFLYEGNDVWLVAGNIGIDV